MITLKSASVLDLALIGLIGVSLVLSWMVFQEVGGSAYSEFVASIASLDAIISKLETIRNTHSSYLYYSSSLASLDVAASGGTGTYTYVWAPAPGGGQGTAARSLSRQVPRPLPRQARRRIQNDCCRAAQHP